MSFTVGERPAHKWVDRSTIGCSDTASSVEANPLRWR
jgi:hypothetical protein